MNKKTKIALIVIIILFIAGMAFYPSIKSFFSTQEKNEKKTDMGKNATSTRNQPLNVNAQVLGKENLNNTFKTKGILIPDEEVSLSFETSGKIIQIYFKEGSFVKKGDLLAKVNDSPLQAELKKLEAQIPLAQDRVFRQKSLLAKDAVSQEAYEAVTTELEKLKADIDLAKARISQTELRAPFDGIIGLRQVSDGAYVSPTTIIAQLTKISPLKIEFSVNERQVNDIKPGLPLVFTVENDLNTYHAQVYAVESRLDVQTLSLKARALYPNPGGKLTPGRSANIEIRLNEITNTIVVPSQAIIAEMGRDIAYIYRSGKAQQVILQKGLRTASTVQILDGLNSGDTLLISGIMQLRDGMPVSIENLIQ